MDQTTLDQAAGEVDQAEQERAATVMATPGVVPAGRGPHHDDCAQMRLFPSSDLIPGTDATGRTLMTIRDGAEPLCSSACVPGNTEVATAGNATVALRCGPEEAQAIQRDIDEMIQRRQRRRGRSLASEMTFVLLKQSFGSGYNTARFVLTSGGWTIEGQSDADKVAADKAAAAKAEREKAAADKAASDAKAKADASEIAAAAGKQAAADAQAKADLAAAAAKTAAAKAEREKVAANKAASDAKAKADASEIAAAADKQAAADAQAKAVQAAAAAKAAEDKVTANEANAEADGANTATDDETSDSLSTTTITLGIGIGGGLGVVLLVMAAFSVVAKYRANAADGGRTTAAATSAKTATTAITIKAKTVVVELKAVDVSNPLNQADGDRERADSRHMRLVRLSASRTQSLDL